MPVVAEAPATGRAQDVFRRFAWGVLAYNVLVVLWGAYVRASGSGDGCGNHWPLCNGEVVPVARGVAQAIEFTHRLTTGVASLAVVALWIFSLRQFPRGHRVRRSALIAVLLIFVEALLGAGLVLLRYVGTNASWGRAAYLSAHLINTQILLGMLAATAWFAGHSESGRRPAILKAALGVALAAAVSGAIAALGDTLYPATSIAGGVASDFAGAAPALLRLRMLHPAVALGAALFLIFATRGRKGSFAVLGLIAIQVAAGLLNWVLLAPVWMQIVHLLIADLLWIALVLVYLRARALS